MPVDADADYWDDELLIRLRSDWTIGTPAVTYKKGSLLATNLEAFLGGKREFRSSSSPRRTRRIADWTGTKTRLVINVLDRRKSRRHDIFSKKPGDTSKTRWTGTELKEAAGASALARSIPNKSDDVWLWLEDFIVPPSLVHYGTASGKREPLKQNPSFFDTKDVVVDSALRRRPRTAPRSRTSRSRSKNARRPATRHSSTATAASRYRSRRPTSGQRRGVGSSAAASTSQANLRGGGEYGPSWHQAAMKHRRQNAYDDFVAVAEDPVKRGVTTPNARHPRRQRTAGSSWA